MHEGVEALRPAPGVEQDGFVRCALLPTHAEEIGWLADSVAHLVRTGTAPGRIAVLCRGGAAFPDIHAALVAREVPVEVVGLGGLLQLPEVADLVSVCEVLQDPTANAALVRLLIGPRWRIGPRDLALLGRRAADLVRTERLPGADPLAAAVAETDPTEVVSLADALETFLEAQPPDELPFSPEAKIRFARLARELRELRRSLAEPLMDVLHRVLAATGLEVELAASRWRWPPAAGRPCTASWTSRPASPTWTAIRGCPPSWPSCGPPRSTSEGWTTACRAARTP